MTNTPVLPHHMRISALQCNFEGGPEKTMLVPSLWQDFGFNVEQLFHTHSEMYSAVFDKEKHGDQVKEYLAESASRGISVILYMNCHILLDSQTDRAPDWARVDDTGDYTRLYGTYYACCLNSTWVDFFHKSIEALRGYPIAGLFFDGPCTGACFCPRCREVFEEENSIPLLGADPTLVEASNVRGRLTFMRRTYRKVKETHPEWVSYFNTSLMHSGFSLSEMQEALGYNDIIGTEGGFQFYGPAKNTDIWRCGLNGKLVEATAGDKRRVIFMAGDHKPWSWYLHTPEETKLCYASTLANGASAWYGIHSNTSMLQGKTADAAKKMVQFDKEHDELYQSTTSAADIALFWSFDTAARYSSSGEKTDFYNSADNRSVGAIGDYSESFQGAYAMLFRSGMAFDVVTEANVEDLSRYRVILLPTAACISESTAELIEQFVRDGGTVIADSETSLYKDSGERRADFRLANLLGVTFGGYRSYQTHDYFSLTDSEYLQEDAVRYLPAPTTALSVSLHGATNVVAKLYPPIPGRYAGRPQTPSFPFITRNSWGKGTAYYFAGTFFELYREHGIPHYRKIIASLTRKNSEPTVELLNAPESVEFTVRRSSRGRLIVHLVNYSGGMNRPINKIIPLRDIRLKVNISVSSVKALVRGEALAVDADGTIVLPEIKEFEVILME